MKMFWLSILLALVIHVFPQNSSSIRYTDTVPAVEKFWAFYDSVRSPLAFAWTGDTLKISTRFYAPSCCDRFALAYHISGSRINFKIIDINPVQCLCMSTPESLSFYVVLPA
jgi:hypothetical protein